MIVDLAVEQLMFTCRHCAHRWRRDYDVVSYEDGDGTLFQYFSVEGQPVPSPYAHASVLCPSCGQPTTFGHLVSRRSIPVPPGGPRRPRTRVPDVDRALVEQGHSPHEPSPPAPV